MDEPIALLLAHAVYAQDKKLLRSSHVTGLMAVLQDKPCPMIHHLRVFEKVLYMYMYMYFALVNSGNGRLFAFRINCVRTYYGNCINAQLFINYTIPLTLIIYLTGVLLL
jgi:hypothetical protein